MDTDIHIADIGRDMDIEIEIETWCFNNFWIQIWGGVYVYVEVCTNKHKQCDFFQDTLYFGFISEGLG